jgi:hypothetical protein
MRKVVLLLLLLLVIPGVFAADSIYVNPVNQTSSQIFYYETAHYTLTIDNEDDVGKVYTWSVNPVEWVIESITSARVEGGEREEFDFKLRPKQSNYRGPGYYSVPITVRDNAGNEQTLPLGVSIKSLSQLEYVSSVGVGASMDAQIDPSQQVELQVVLRNRNIKDLVNLSLTIDGQTFNKVDTLDLAGLQEKTINYRFDVDPLTEPSGYQLNIVLRGSDGKVISQFTDDYEIIAYGRTVRDYSASTKLFEKTQVLDVTNEANVLREIPVYLNVSWYKLPFTSVDLEAANYERASKREFIVQLEPYESSRFTVNQNYTLLPALLIIIIGSIVAYFVLRSPIVLKKQIIVTGHDDEGVNEMKVRVYVRNRTDKSFFNLRLIDKTPSIASVIPPSGLGVMEPEKIIKTEKKGTIIKWDFDTLEAYEERIVTYSIKSRLKIVGNIGLPPVKIKFENAKGKSRTTQSEPGKIGQR